MSVAAAASRKGSDPRSVLAGKARVGGAGDAGTVADRAAAPPRAQEHLEDGRDVRANDARGRVAVERKDGRHLRVTLDGEQWVHALNLRRARAQAAAASKELGELQRRRRRRR